MKHTLRRAILALVLIAGFTPAIAQVPSPVPALPDTERRTSYSITASTCACAVNFALYGDSTDYQNWVEVFINGTRVANNDSTRGWTITSPSGSLSNLPRPIANAVLTFNAAQTGTVQIVGARRPRRTSQFSENAPVPTRNFNVVLSDLTAQNREIWDKTNDVTGRALLSQPGVTLGLLPIPSLCANGFLGFDATGLIPLCRAGGPGSGNVVGPLTSATGNIAWWNNTMGTLLGASPAFQPSNPANAALYSQIATPPAGAGTFSAMQIGIGTALTAADMPSPTGRLSQAIVGTSVIDATDTMMSGYGTVGFGVNNSTSLANSIGVGGWSFCNGAAGSSNCWGMAAVAHNKAPSATVGVDANSVMAIEADIAIWKKAAGVEPTIPQLYGISVLGGGDSTANQGIAYAAGPLSVVTGAKWATGFSSLAGASLTALFAGPIASSGVSLATQPIVMEAVNSSGTHITYSIQGDALGDLILQSPTNGQVALGDPLGNYVVTSPGAGGAKVRFPALAVAGFIANDASGNLSTSPFGTGVKTALGINVGSAGAPVLVNGALGTPSSGSAANLTGLPISTGVAGLGTGVATLLATPSSANLRAALTDETGTGAAVFANSPALVTPTGIVKGDVGLGNVANSDTTNAANITSGTLPNARIVALPTNTNLFLSTSNQSGLMVAGSTFYGGVGAIAGSEGPTQVPVSAPGTIKNLYVTSSVAPGGAQTTTVTLRKNAVSQTLTCAITGAATTCNDTTHTVAVVAGDLIDMQIVQSASAATTNSVSAGMTLVTTSP